MLVFHCSYSDLITKLPGQKSPYEFPYISRGKNSEIKVYSTELFCTEV